MSQMKTGQKPRRDLHHAALPVGLDARRAHVVEESRAVQATDCMRNLLENGLQQVQELLDPFPVVAIGPVRRSQAAKQAQRCDQPPKISWSCEQLDCRRTLRNETARQPNAEGCDAQGLFLIRSPPRDFRRMLLRDRAKVRSVRPGVEEHEQLDAFHVDEVHRSLISAGRLLSVAKKNRVENEDNLPANLEARRLFP
eukprot:scaffold7328_cov314-Pinguiococcus_pyrenoidosus.AAC.40